MADKSGGDILQGNAAMQGNLSSQGLNSIASGGVGAVDAIGGSAFSEAFANQSVNQDQTQSNSASSGDGGSDNVQADTNVNI